MSKKKGVSAEEKKTRMLQLFQEKKEFFQLKELEKIAPKEKGIIAQSVKDVVQSLVDDGLIDTDKIGTSVYYWAYPSKARIIREAKLKEVKDKLANVTERLEASRKLLEEAKAGKEDSQERTAVLERLEELKKKQDELNAEIDKYKDNDPEVLEEMKTETKVCLFKFKNFNLNFLILEIKGSCQSMDRQHLQCKILVQKNFLSRRIDARQAIRNPRRFGLFRLRHVFQTPSLLV